MVIVGERTALAKTWMAYQVERFGVTRFDLVLYSRKVDPEALRAACPVEFRHLVTLDEQDFSPIHRRETLRQFHPSGEQALFLDLDEFPEPELKLYLDQGFPAIAGYWIDRLPRDGSLNRQTIDPGTSLDRQFPFASAVRPYLIEKYEEIVVACRYVNPNHHPTSDPILRALWEHVPRVPVHHFRWTAGVEKLHAERTRHPDRHDESRALDARFHRNIVERGAVPPSLMGPARFLGV